MMCWERVVKCDIYIYLFVHFHNYSFPRISRTSISNRGIINKTLFFFPRLSFHPPSFQQPFFSTSVILAEDGPLSRLLLVHLVSFPASLSLSPLVPSPRTVLGGSWRAPRSIMTLCSRHCLPLNAWTLATLSRHIEANHTTLRTLLTRYRADRERGVASSLSSRGRGRCLPLLIFLTPFHSPVSRKLIFYIGTIDRAKLVYGDKSSRLVSSAFFQNLIVVELKFRTFLF